MNLLGVIVSIALLAAGTTATGDYPLAAIANIVGSDGRVNGNVSFTQDSPNGIVTVQAYITGLTAGDHGFHIHEKGDISNGCLNAGPHYNPDKLDHGAPTDRIRHVGDLGNVPAGSTGVVSTTLTDHLITLSGPRSILGRAVVIHIGKDDLGLGGAADSKTTGNAGGRAGCGVIGIK